MPGFPPSRATPFSSITPAHSKSHSVDLQRFGSYLFSAYTQPFSELISHFFPAIDSRIIHPPAFLTLQTEVIFLLKSALYISQIKEPPSLQLLRSHTMKQPELLWFSHIHSVKLTHCSMLKTSAGPTCLFLNHYYFYQRFTPQKISHLLPALLSSSPEQPLGSNFTLHVVLQRELRLPNLSVTFTMLFKNWRQSDSFPVEVKTHNPQQDGNPTYCLPVSYAWPSSFPLLQPLWPLYWPGTC